MMATKSGPKGGRKKPVNSAALKNLADQLATLSTKYNDAAESYSSKGARSVDGFGNVESGIEALDLFLMRTHVEFRKRQKNRHP